VYLPCLRNARGAIPRGVQAKNREMQHYDGSISMQKHVLRYSLHREASSEYNKDPKSKRKFSWNWKDEEK
jgi:hypothetical protein